MATSNKRNTIEFAIPLQPKPMPRPRVAKFGGVFYPADYKKFEKQLDALIEEALLGCAITGQQDPEALFTVQIESICPQFKTVVRAAPMGDVDNLAKPIMDRITRLGLMWLDDRAVMVLTTLKRFALPEEEPHYRITIKRIA